MPPNPTRPPSVCVWRRHCLKTGRTARRRQTSSTAWKGGKPAAAADGAGRAVPQGIARTRCVEVNGGFSVTPRTQYQPGETAAVRQMDFPETGGRRRSIKLGAEKKMVAEKRLVRRLAATCQQGLSRNKFNDMTAGVSGGIGFVMAQRCRAGGVRKRRTYGNDACSYATARAFISTVSKPKWQTLSSAGRGVWRIRARRSDNTHLQISNSLVFYRMRANIGWAVWILPRAQPRRPGRQFQHYGLRFAWGRNGAAAACLRCCASARRNGIIKKRLFSGLKGKGAGIKIERILEPLAPGITFQASRRLTLSHRRTPG